MNWRKGDGSAAGEVNLRAQAQRLYHMGFRCQTISRNILAHANATRPWQIYADFAQHLIGLARPLYATDPLAVDLDATVYAFDATTIDLYLSVFPWGAVSHHQGGHQAAHAAGSAGTSPTVIHITDGKTHEVTMLDDLVIEPGAVLYAVKSRLAEMTFSVSHSVTVERGNRW